MFSLCLIVAVLAALSTIAVSLFASATGTERMWPYAWPRLAAAAGLAVASLLGRSMDLAGWGGLALLAVTGLGFLALAVRRRRSVDYGDGWSGLLSADPVGTVSGGVAIGLTPILLVVRAFPVHAADLAPSPASPSLVTVIVTVLCLAIIVALVVRAVYDYRRTPGTSILTATRGSLTILWTYVLAVASALVEAAGHVADFLGDPAVGDTIRGAIKPEWVPWFGVAIAVITYMVRHRSLAKE